MSCRAKILLMLGTFTCISAGTLWLVTRQQTMPPDSEPFPYILEGDPDSPSFVVLQQTISEAGLHSDERVTNLNARAMDVLEIIKKTSEELNLRFVGPLNFAPDSGTISSSGAKLDSKSYNFLFWLPSAQMTGWQNNELLSYLSPHQAGTQAPPSPRWTKDMAFKVGDHFLHALLKRTGDLMVRDDAVFCTDPNGPATGYWVMTWNRTDEHGYFFDNEKLEITIPEGYCPFYIGIPEITSSKESPAPSVSLARAIVIARVEIPSATKWIVPTAPSIVKNHLFWVFRYEAPDNFLGLVEPLYIDANTGKIVPTMRG